jgi:hypothetical protein
VVFGSLIQLVQRNCDEPAGKRAIFEGHIYAAPQKFLSETQYFIGSLRLIHRKQTEAGRWTAPPSQAVKAMNQRSSGVFYVFWAMKGT